MLNCLAVLLIAIALAVPAAPVAAQVPMNPLGMATEAEQSLLPALAEAIALLESSSDLAAGVRRLDQLLTQLPAPTRLRGYVQTRRAESLLRMEYLDSASFDRARAAIDEGIRLLPDEAIPKLVGAYIHTFTGNGGRAADLWLTASREAPTIARQSDAYAIEALLGRLRDAGDIRRADLITARLSEIGFQQGGAVEQSKLAMATIDAKLRAGDVAGAQSLVPSLIDPAQHVSMLIDNEYRALWPTIEDWAGRRLEKQWPAYLTELKRNWGASNDLKAGTDYAAALRRINENGTVVDIFLPFLAPDRVTADTEHVEYLAPIVASALRAIGRQDEAVALLQRLEMLHPAHYANRLNYSANIARILFELGQPAKSLAMIDRVIADAEKFGDEVNTSAKVGMHAIRACALHELGRGSEAAPSIAMVTAARVNAASSYMSMLSCTGKPAEARAFLMGLLQDRDRRGYALGYVQPSLEPPLSPRQLRLKRFHEALRTDPALLKSVNRYGRILPFPVNEAPR